MEKSFYLLQHDKTKKYLNMKKFWIDGIEEAQKFATSKVAQDYKMIVLGGSSYISVIKQEFVIDNVVVV